MMYLSKRECVVPHIVDEACSCETHPVETSTDSRLLDQIAHYDAAPTDLGERSLHCRRHIRPLLFPVTASKESLLAIAGDVRYPSSSSVIANAAAVEAAPAATATADARAIRTILLFTGAVGKYSKCRLVRKSASTHNMGKMEGETGFSDAKVALMSHSVRSIPVVRSDSRQFCIQKGFSVPEGGY